MKLPDFSTFKPLNENREKMDAALPQDLSFVTIDERLDETDLERRKTAPPKASKPASPAQPAAAKAKVINEQDIPGQVVYVQVDPNRAVSPKGRVNYTQTIVKTPVSQILLIVQLVFLANYLAIAGIFWYFGAPWERHPMVVQNFYTQVEQKGYVSKQAPKANMKTPEATKPYYKRNEYWDKNGVRHTVIEMLPSEQNKGAPAKPQQPSQTLPLPPPRP